MDSSNINAAKEIAKKAHGRILTIWIHGYKLFGSVFEFELGQMHRKNVGEDTQQLWARKTFPRLQTFDCHFRRYLFEKLTHDDYIIRESPLVKVCTLLRGHT